ncbi:EamA family transporter [Ferrimonas sp. YFM]|uniref:EamA family transporter n=1 Tax=Ferrimonas sp. YFM TaxID=3028878 RepID=UPI0025736314|nr:EamA family transporter [Ferrimonas sp. YFM]BDY04188.1 membrane protein [Ferrimonas sp. YFM]
MFHKLEIVIAFSIFGMLPLYLNLMPETQVTHLVALRIILGSAILFGLLLVRGKWRPLLRQVKRDPKAALCCMLAAPLAMAAGLLSIWAYLNQQILAASLGQYLSPFVSVLLAVVLLRERLSPLQKLALIAAAIGLMLQFGNHSFSVLLAVGIGALFALYGFLKKCAQTDTFTSLILEHLAVLPLALGYWGYLHWQGEPSLISDQSSLWLQLGFAPLILFALTLLNHGIQKVNFTTYGLMQFIDPSLQFLLGIWVFNELCPPEQLLGFMLIWGGLAAVIGSGLRKHQGGSAKLTQLS